MYRLENKITIGNISDEWEIPLAEHVLIDKQVQIHADALQIGARGGEQARQHHRAAAILDAAGDDARSAE